MFYYSCLSPKKPLSPVYIDMRSFYEFMMLFEQDPGGMGGPPGMPPGGMGGPPGMGGPGGGLGGLPGMPGGLGGPPGGMGGPGGPMGGGNQAPMKIEPLTVWDVLERIIEGKPVQTHTKSDSSRQADQNNIDSGQPPQSPAMPGQPPGGPAGPGQPGAPTLMGTPGM
jgi:hypothetical protein